MINENVKFAKIDFVIDKNLLPIKFKLSKIDSFKNWYISKFNPFIQNEITLGKSTGLDIKLALTHDEMINDPTLFQDLFSRTLETLKNDGVEIITSSFPCSHNMYTPNPVSIMSFLIFPILENSISKVGKIFKNIEIAIIDDGSVHTNIIIENIYNHINYLSLVTSFDHSSLIEKVYNDNGLNITTFKNDSSIISSADIVIYLKNDFFEPVHSLKSGAIFIDLSMNKNSTYNLCLKRMDVLTIDNLNLNYYGNIYNLLDFELAYYVKSNYYRNFKKYNRLSSNSKIKNELLYNDVRIHSFFRLNKPLSHSHYLDYKNSIK